MQTPSARARRQALWLTMLHGAAAFLALWLTGAPNPGIGGAVIVLSSALLFSFVLRALGGPKERSIDHREPPSSADPRAEAEETQGEERLTMLAGAERLSGVGGWTYDPTSGDLLWSPNLFRICGLDPERFEPSLDLVRSAIHRDDLDRFLRALRRVTLKGGSLEQQIRVFLPDGEMRYHLVKAEAAAGDDGRVSKVLGASRDITRRERGEVHRRTLEVQVQQLQRLEAIGTLAGGIAHDFNNILGASMGFTDMALDALPQDHPVVPCLEEIERANRRARDLVGQILTFSRRVERPREPVNLCAVVREALGLLRASLPADVAVQHDVPLQPTRVSADSSQLHQVLINLCTNAFQAMPRGGTLRIVVDTVEQPEAFDTTTFHLPSGNYARLSIRDTGHGIDADTLERIFDPFFTTKPEGEGTGLGLSTVNGIVLDHLGGIDVSSEIGEGTRFDVFLPLCDSESGTDPEGIPLLTLGERQTVMMIDDESALVELGERMLERLGYRPVVFDNARLALEAFRDDPEPFDLVLTDLRMPEISGIDLALEIRRLAPDLPIVVTTGYGDPRLEQELAAGTIQEVLPKPFKLAAVGECVARVLAAKRPTAD
ncbi:MAG: ATP-binding protein [Acidobacteriota bacterium]